MSFDPDEIVQNAQQGVGACAGCPANEDTEGQFVNPGLLNTDAEVMFVTMDPSHRTNWDSFPGWAEYNADKSPKFKQWRGGRALSKLLSKIPEISIDDVWLADAVKCPVNNDLAGDVRTDEAFDHCVTYLREEVETIDPEVIVTLGNDPAEQLLEGVFDIEVGSIKAGTRDCGRTFDTSPPVVISPHWSNGWLGRNNNRQVVRDAIQSVRGSDTPEGENVFLVPCDSPNYEETVLDRINLNEFPEHPGALDGYKYVRLWGARVGETNQSYFDKMGPGDLALFYQEGDYIGVGTVGKTFLDDGGWVSSKFWRGAPSKYIYTITDFSEIAAPKSSVNTIFGYKDRYYPQGLTRVADSRVTNRLEAIKLALEKRYGLAANTEVE